ncbi:MAG: hypothetical protein QM778_26375 [Myxococcales bacterium]
MPESSALREALAGFPARRGGPRAIAARARLVRVLFSPRGARKLPSQTELDRALRAISEPDLAWLCEFSPLAPLYFLPTRPFVTRLAATLRELGARRVLEVAAGDGFLARSLAAHAPDLEVFASDSGAWEDPQARMTPAERRRLRGQSVPGLRLGGEVARLSARAAIRKFQPDLVLCAWLPPGNLLDTLIRAQVRHVLEIGAGHGVTASAYSWRFAHEFLEGSLAARARCRLDDQPENTLHSRITLYFGRAHPEYFEERVRPGDWLFQFKP